MATKIQHIDEIYNLLGSLKENVHKKQIEYAINTVYNQLIYDMTFEEQNKEAFASKEYTGVDVLLDTTKNWYYSVLPAEQEHPCLF